MLHRHTPTRAVLGAVIALVFALAACGGDGGDSEAGPAPSSPDTEAPDVDAGNSGTEDDTEAPPDPEGNGDPEVDVGATSGDPTGRLVLDGVEYPLTFDADDPNAQCAVLVVGAITVSGMRTPDGNRVDVTAQDIPRPNVMATYFDDSEVTLWSIATDGSSTEPEWTVDGSTVSVSGRWFHRQDTSIDEVEGELVVTC